jgi:uncharacterized protein with ATP-grasp and redox domains
LKAYLECMACFVRQAIDGARLATADATVREQIVREVIKKAAEFPMNLPPSDMSVDIYEIVRRVSGNDDPFSEVKKESNRFALDLYPEMKQLVETSDRPFETAVRLAIAGNIIDSGIAQTFDLDDVHETVDHALEAPLNEELLETFNAAVDRAENILYVADNAGEIVFDRLLIDLIGPEKVTVAVKSGPIINDATMQDAETAGLTGMVRVVESGCVAAGTSLAMCNDEFMEIFDTADLVVAKGQGNFEALEEADKPIFFLLKAKCDVIARHMECKLGDIMLRATDLVTR